jgi:hypothetical protein
MGPGPIFEKMLIIYGIFAAVAKIGLIRREKYKNGACPHFLMGKVAGFRPK